MTDQELLTQTKEYLKTIQIPSNEKNLVMDFCKKEIYRQNLMQVMINEVGDIPVSIGYGNVNANICFIFESEKTLSIMKPLVQKLLNRLQIEFWTLYVTFVNKTEQEYQNKFELLAKEISAVRPKVVYFFCNGDESIVSLKKTFAANGISLPKLYLVPMDKFIQDDDESYKELWKIFRYMINYKNKTKR